MLWIAVHLPQLSLESFAATVDPAWQGQRPLALIEAHRITQADARAAALGIQPGTKRATALSAGEATWCSARPIAARGCVGPAGGRLCGAGLHADGVPARPPTAPAHRRRWCCSRCRRVCAASAVFAPLLAAAAAARCNRSATDCQIASAPTALGAALLARWRDDLVQRRTQRRSCRAAPLARRCTGVVVRAWARTLGGLAGHGPEAAVRSAPSAARRAGAAASARRCWPTSTARAATRPIRASRSCCR